MKVLLLYLYIATSMYGLFYYLWQRKPSLSSGFALGLGRFTAINPCQPGYNYYVYRQMRCVGIIVIHYINKLVIAYIGSVVYIEPITYAWHLSPCYIL